MQLNLPWLTPQNLLKFSGLRSPKFGSRKLSAILGSHGAEHTTTANFRSSRLALCHVLLAGCLPKYHM